ncbi:MAG: tRNA pseudouridine(55) synthase TruB [Gammaproteobacteria bacterium]|nr:tRNA pseudouridine(55) synthase TruB [Gammaproteobacteria bacterium]
MQANSNRDRVRVARRAVNGILLLDKPVGISSNAALQRARRIFNARKAGHTGNLDVLADGLLPVCFGEATKFTGFLLDADKTYRSDFCLGQETTTGDREGSVVFEGDVVGIDAVARVIERFTGVMEQVPPMHSALKHHGQPLYKLALRGIEVERAPRRIVIHEIRVNQLAAGILSVDVRCSKGTYIRTLATDIGRALGCGAHVASLRRLQAGPFDVRDAATLDELEAEALQGFACLDRRLLPIDRALAGCPTATLTADEARRLQRGQKIQSAHGGRAGPLRLYDPEGGFIGVGELSHDGMIAPRRLVAQLDVD